MWLGKIRMRHDCIIGNRCRRFGVTTLGTPFSVYVEKGVTYSPQVQTIYGEGDKVRAFIEDLKREKRVKNLEHEGNTIFCIEVRKEKIPATYYHNRLFYVKPVFVDKEGYEYWEVASWDRKVIMEFVEHLQKDITEVKILKIKEINLTDIYFSHLMPRLTEKQKRALLLAQEKGWYSWPRRTSFGELAEAMGVSIPTFREHLKRAEEKLIPELARTIK
jgi:predicted DNA binding protein